MSTPHSELHVLVLAAGAARRYGAVKQLARIDGEPLLRRVVHRAGAIAARTWVILGAHAEQLTPLLADLPVTVCINSRWSEGLAQSIRAGIERLPPSCGGAMLVLADQARISAQDYSRLAEAWRHSPDSLIAAHYGAHSGAPVIFPRRVFGELERLSGDVGARSVLERHAREVLAVPMPSAAFDLDTPADLAVMVDSATR